MSGPPRKKVLLIQPTIYDDRGRLIKRKKLYFVGLTLPLLAALAPDWDVEICIETIEDVPFDTDADLIGIGSMGHSLVRGEEIAREFKARGKTVVVGGYMASLIPALTITGCDAVVVGDAEKAWPRLLADYAAGQLQEFYEDPLDALSTPLPEYGLVTTKPIGDFLPVQAGRGCPKSCTFCSIACLYRGKYLRREIPEVMRDIRAVKDLGYRKFLLIDDNILSDRRYARALCEQIATLGMEWYSQCSIELAKDPELLRVMVDSGCSTLSFGIETVTASNLIKVNKRWCHPDEYTGLLRTLREAGLLVATEMMIGLEDDTPESLRRTAKFVIDNKIAAPKFYIVTPIPGTPLFDEMRAAGKLVHEDVRRYSPSKAAINTANLSADDIDRLFWELYREVYSVRNILRRLVFTRQFFRSPRRSLFMIGVNFLYRQDIRRGIAPIVI